MSRIASCFKNLKRKKRGAFIPYIESGDPDYQTALTLLKAMPIKAGTTMQKTFQMVREF